MTQDDNMPAQLRQEIEKINAELTHVRQRKDREWEPESKEIRLSIIAFVVLAPIVVIFVFLENPTFFWLAFATFFASIVALVYFSDKRSRVIKAKRNTEISRLNELLAAKKDELTLYQLADT